jgi:hypothetical protein
MRDARPRFEHEAGHTTHRDMGAYAGDIDDHKSPVEDIDLFLLDKQDREAIFDRNGFER